MRRDKLIDMVAEEFTHLPKFEITRIINSFLESIKKSLINKEIIELRGFGTFAVKQRKPKKARNPKTGKEVMLEARNVPTFKAGTLLKKWLMKELILKLLKIK